MTVYCFFKGDVNASVINIVRNVSFSMYCIAAGSSFLPLLMTIFSSFVYKTVMSWNRPSLIPRLREEFATCPFLRETSSKDEMISLEVQS